VPRGFSVSHPGIGTVRTLVGKRTKSRGRRSVQGKTASPDPQMPVPNDRPPLQARQRPAWSRWIVSGVILAGIFLWAYWPTLSSLASTWNREPDYSHGFLVTPLAVFFLWIRRDRFPGIKGQLAWLGLIPIGLSVGMRIVAARFYMDAMDGWSILLWVAGVVWLFGGWRVLWWSLPAVAFLWFMVPLPFRAERWLSVPLQGVNTKLSCWALQILGQPALAEGHRIWLGDHPLDVERACCGLRILVGTVALAFAYVIIVRPPWWEKIALLAGVIPIALVANSTRIVATGLLYRYVSGDVAQAFAHDSAGWAMIVLAAGLFGLLLWYLSKLLPEVELVGVGAVVDREHGRGRTTTATSAPIEQQSQ